MPTIPTQNLFNALMQIYQATGQTAGPYANLGSILQQFYGAQGASNYQGSLFGYGGSGQPGSVGAPLGPPGGFLGAPTAPGQGPVGPVQGAAQPPVAGPVQGGGSGATGGTIMPDGTVAPPGFNPYPVGASGGGTSNTLYSPPEGTLIGLGKDNPFMDPYAGQVPASQTGYQPGLLDVNTSALNSYGPLATNALLNANPYLSDSLNFTNLAQYDASQPLQPSNVLNQLNTIAGDKLNPATFGQLSDQERRDLSQGAFTSLGVGGLTHGNTGLVADLLGRDRYVQQRQQSAEALGSMVQGLNSTQQGQELQRIGMAGNLANQSAANASSSITSPILQLLGFNTNLSSQASPGSAIENSSALFNPFQQIGSNILGFNANANANSSIANANQSSALTSGLLNLGGNILQAFSDKRLKKNVRTVGKSPSGIAESEWTYKTDKKRRRFHGATAQAVEKVAPHAVLEDPVSGIKAVDYSKIDVPFYEVDPYSKLRKAA